MHGIKAGAKEKYFLFSSHDVAGQSITFELSLLKQKILQYTVETTVEMPQYTGETSLLELAFAYHHNELLEAGRG